MTRIGLKGLGQDQDKAVPGPGRNQNQDKTKDNAEGIPPLPVMSDSSAVELPTRTFPSTGNFPPGATRTTSPFWTSWTITCSSLTHTHGESPQHSMLEECGRSLAHLVMLRSGPSVTKVASVACRDINLARASEVFLWTIMERAGEY